MMIIFELKAHFKSILIWGLTLAFLYAVVFIEFNAYYDNPEMAEILKVMPESLLDAFGMDGANLTTLTGFISVLTVYIYLPLSIQAAVLGNGILASLERDKTSEFLITLPISRVNVLFRKYVSALIISFIILLIGMASISLSSLRFSPDQDFFKFLFLVALVTYGMQFFFISIGLFSASFFKRHKISSAIAISLPVVMYLVSFVIGLGESIDFLKYVTPFKLFEAIEFSKTLSINLTHLSVMILIGIIGFVFSLLFYDRKDLSV